MVGVGIVSYAALQYNCGNGLLYAVTGANNNTESFMHQHSLITIDPTTGTSTVLCSVVDTSSYNEVIAFPDANTLLYFTGTIVPVMSVLHLDSVVADNGQCALTTVDAYTVNAPPLYHSSAVIAAIAVGDGATVLAVVGRRVMSVSVAGDIAWIGNLTEDTAGFLPFSNGTSIAFTGGCSNIGEQHPSNHSPSVGAVVASANQCGARAAPGLGLDAPG